MATELIYGLDLSTQKNKEFINTLKRNGILFKNEELSGEASFVEDEEIDDEKVPSFRIGLIIGDNGEKGNDVVDVYDVDEGESKVKYTEFKDELIEYLTQRKFEAIDELISEYFTEQDKQNLLSSLDWLIKRLKETDPFFYFIQK